MSLLLENTESSRLYYRKIAQADFKLWLPFYDDPDSTRYWEGIPDIPETACREQFDRIFERYANDLGGMNALIHKSTEEFVGMAGLLVQQVDGRSELEIGYSLLPGFRGRGFATEAAVHAKQYAFKRQLAESLISIIHIRNIPSQQVALRNGMQLEKSTTYKDNPVFIYRINN